MRNPSSFLLSVLILLGASTASAAEGRSVRGTIVDHSGSAIPGAQIVLLSPDSAPRDFRADALGRFALADVAAGSTLRIEARGFQPAAVSLGKEQRNVRVELAPAPVEDVITVIGARPVPTRSTSATKTDTPLRDVPQAITVITRDIMAQQTMRSMGDVVRYVPGIGIAQGEGNRDTPVFRGNSSTSDFFVDGIRDDVQYFRDIYNVERIEALKGPNAMIFGRGGVGGVLNRVTRQADWTPSREVTLQGGSWDDRRITADFGQALGASFSARVTGMYESSDSYRDGVTLDRHGINPTIALALGPNTILRAGYEYFRDERTADRGISSFGGRPVSTDASTFFGNPDLSLADATVNAFSSSLEHRFRDDVSLRSRVGFTDYDKFYQNVYPGEVDEAGRNVSISAYNNATRRENLFSQTDLVVERQTGRFGHTILAGVEIGRQVTDNFRNTGYFTSLGSDVRSVLVPLTAPSTGLPVEFRQSATDADNHGTARTTAFYLQDQIVLTPRLQAIAGIRYDDFQVDILNRRTGATFQSDDGLVSPRLGLIFKPAESVSFYASHSLSYLPRAGEQLSSLNLSNQSLEPEEFRNYEIGAKWDMAGRVEFSTAVYRLERTNVAVAHPTDPGVTMLVKGQETEGVEIGMTGNLTSAWSVVGAYAWQEGEITSSLSPSAPAGARLAQVPEHSFSLWNKYDVSESWGLGLGVIHRGDIFTSTDNSVTVPGFTRVDGALFYTVSRQLRAQLNVENLLDTDYYASAHSNTNITPGSPLAVRLSLTTRF